MQKWGMTALGIRLDDKLSRINNLVTSENLSYNGESLLDNLFDLAGYSVLGIRYLLEQDKLTSEDMAKYFSMAPEDIAEYFSKGSEND